MRHKSADTLEEMERERDKKSDFGKVPIDISKFLSRFYSQLLSNY